MEALFINKSINFNMLKILVSEVSMHLHINALQH